MENPIYGSSDKRPKKLSWRAPVANRTKGMGCPYFTNKKVFPGLNDLATTHPHLALQWHPLKNGALTPEQVTYGCSKQVWWYLEYYDEELGKTIEFEWKSSVNARTNRDTGCPYLSNAAVWTVYNDLKTRYPEIAAEWDYERNGDLIPEKVIATSNISVWWKIPYMNPQTGQTLYLSWQTRISNRTISQTACPYLTNTAVYPGLNDLQTQYPEIAYQWHPFRNGILKPNQVFPYDMRSVWWYLPYTDPSTGKIHYFEWVQTVTLKVRSLNDCPYTAGHAVWTGYNDLQSCFPDIAEQWSEKNRFLKPDRIYKFSKMKAWWKCHVCGMNWRTSIRSRTTRGTGCPGCARKNKNIFFN